MYFELTEEQREFGSLTREVLSERAGPPLLRRLTEPKAESTDPVVQQELWRQLIEVGLPALLVTEEAGGLGAEEVALVAVAEEFGRACVPLPLSDTLALAPEIGPELLATWAEPAVGLAGRDGTLIPWPDLAELVVIEGRLHTPGAAMLSGVPSIDRTRPLAEFTPTGPGSPVVAPALAAARACVATAAELIGLSRAMLELATDHVKQREQFGVAIGSFQAVKHHLADVRIAIDFAAPAVHHAAWLLSDRGAEDAWARLILAQAKQRANDAALITARWVIQCHGGMGYTTEYDLHFFAKRAWALTVHHGSSRIHRRTIIDHLGLLAATGDAAHCTEGITR